MRQFPAVLGRHDVTVVAPEAGTDPAELTRLFSATFPPAPRRPYGLDVESTYLTPLAQFDPDFRVRLVQFGVETRPPVGEHRGGAVAWVLRMDDPAQRAAALELLADRRVTFASHSNMDVLSSAALGVDITARNVDTLSLAQMADPDKEDDRDLKSITRRYLGAELAEADGALYARFLELYREEHPEVGRRAVKRSTVEAWGWAHISADDPVYLLYAGLDAVAVHLAAPLLVRATRAPARLLEVEQFLDVQANRIQLRGMRVDGEALETLHAEAKREVGAAEAEVLEATGGVKARSPKLLDWLAGHGVDWDRWDGARSEQTGAPSLAKDNVRLLYDFPLDDAGRAAVDGLVRLRGHLDLLNKTNGVREHLDPYGYVHPVLNPRGATTTARMSSAGPNFQNFSKRDPRMRGIFVPEPGCTLVTIDFDQVELRVVAALAREEKMIDVILAGGDLHQLTVDELAASGIGITRDTGKMTNFLCVPSEGEDEAEILTRRGWLRHDEVRVGDETLGHDGGVLRWTPVTAVHHYEDAELVRLGNGQSWSAVCTPDHRWVEQRRRQVDGVRQLVDGFTATRDLNTESRILLSAPAETGTDVALTPEECALIGWAYADGSVRIAPLTGRTGQGVDGQRRHVKVSIFQSKPEGLAEIRRALVDVAHTERVRPAVGELRPVVEFALPAVVARDIWRRAGLLDGVTLPEMVLLMSREQRGAFNRAVFAAEGHVSAGGQRIIGQNEGDLCDAIELGAFLDGNYVRKYAATHRGNHPFRAMSITKPRVTGQRLRREPAGRGSVWCVTTELGSWVMRQAGRIMLTGNCVYGGGGKALHEQSGIPLAEAAEIVRAHRARYTSIAAYSRYLGMEREAIRTISGRRLPITVDRRRGTLRTYATVNYAVQSAARELLVDAWWRFATEFGRAETLWFPVHDELVLQIPEGEVSAVVADAEECMRFDFRGVPISATAIELRDEEGVSRWMTSKLAEKHAAARAAA